MNIGLGQCLHCGALHPEVTSYVDQPLRHRIKCTECPHVIDCFSSTLDQAKSAWNRRSDANLADAQAEIARLRGALDELLYWDNGKSEFATARRILEETKPKSEECDE